MPFRLFPNEGKWEHDLSELLWAEIQAKNKQWSSANAGSYCWEEKWDFLGNTSCSWAVCHDRVVWPTQSRFPSHEGARPGDLAISKSLTGIILITRPEIPRESFHKKLLGWMATYNTSQAIDLWRCLDPSRKLDFWRQKCCFGKHCKFDERRTRKNVLKQWAIDCCNFCRTKKLKWVQKAQGNVADRFWLLQGQGTRLQRDFHSANQKWKRLLQSCIGEPQSTSHCLLLDFARQEKCRHQLWQDKMIHDQWAPSSFINDPSWHHTKGQRLQKRSQQDGCSGRS